MISSKAKILLALIGLILFVSCRKDPPELLLPEGPTTEFRSVDFSIESERKAHFFDEGYLLARQPHLRLTAPLARDRNEWNRLDTIQYLSDYQDDQEPFIESLLDSVGYPLWSQTQGTEQLRFIPLVAESATLTSAILVVQSTEGTHDFKLLRRHRIYNNYLATRVHPNYAAELQLFRGFDQLLFQAVDPLLEAAWAAELATQAGERCPSYWYWECTEWIVPFAGEGPTPEAEYRSTPCGSVCVSCLLIVYTDPACEEQLPGWGRTGGRTFPPEREGSSSYPPQGNGGGRDGAGGGGNPGNWWEERAYPHLLVELIADLGLAAEDADLADCIGANYELMAYLHQLLAELPPEDYLARQQLHQALVAACHCDDYDAQGREQCDARTLVAEAYARAQAEYWHAWFESHYLDYARAEVDLEAFLLRYGPERYVQLAELYRDFQLAHPDQTEMAPLVAWVLKKLA